MRLPTLRLALLAAAAAWSPLELQTTYLDCSRTPLPGRLDLFTSFRSVRGTDGDHSLFARDFYNTYLAYWPLDVGQLIILHEQDTRTARPAQRLVRCLEQATCVNKPVAKSFDLSFLHDHKVTPQHREVNANFTSIDDVQMQVWKYVLDWHSDALLLGVLDDDACLLDHVLRGDVVSCANRVVVRGVRFTRRRVKTKHEVSNGFLGIASDVNFMVDFPVVFHRGHLEAFRRHVVRHVLHADYSPRNWWRSVADLLKRGWRPSEYSNLMGFALVSARWRERYDFQIVPNHQRPVMGVASHKLGACAVPLETLRDRDAAAFVERTLPTWLYPRDAAPYVTHAAPGLLAENDWNGRVDAGWAPYERRVRDSPAFARFLALRQAALLAHAAGRNVSLREACGRAIHGAWAACFAAVRTPPGRVWGGPGVYRPS
jgi:hypothetical protein